MRISSADGSQFIELSKQEDSLPLYPGTCVQIEGSAYGFSAISHVWLKTDDMHVFLSELVRLEQLHNGSATLVSMSPDEASLSLQAVDRVGHIIARLHLTRNTYTPTTQLVTQRLSIAFEIDVSLLPNIVRQFRQLIPAG